MATSRLALVTGAAGGIGRAVAERLARDVAIVVVADVDGRAAETQAKALRQAGREAEAVEVDVADESSVNQLFETVDGRWKRVDILVNCAGILGLHEGQRSRVSTMPLAVWRRTLDVNLTGTFLMCRGVAPIMQRGKWGRIVNIGSRVGRTRTGLGNAHYAASKAGLLGFSRVLAGELGADGITVNCVAPSKVVTNMTRVLPEGEGAFAGNISETVVGRLGTVDDVASAVAYLCSEQAGFVTGAIIDVTGGSFMP